LGQGLLRTGYVSRLERTAQRLEIGLDGLTPARGGGIGWGGIFVVVMMVMVPMDMPH